MSLVQLCCQRILLELHRNPLDSAALAPSMPGQSEGSASGSRTSVVDTGTGTARTAGTTCTTGARTRQRAKLAGNSNPSTSPFVPPAPARPSAALSRTTDSRRPPHDNPGVPVSRQLASLPSDLLLLLITESSSDRHTSTPTSSTASYLNTKSFYLSSLSHRNFYGTQSMSPELLSCFMQHEFASYSNPHSHSLSISANLAPPPSPAPSATATATATSVASTCAPASPAPALRPFKYGFCGLESLTRYWPLTTIDLSHCVTLADEAVFLLARGLASNTSVTVLNLTNCNFGHRAVVPLCLLLLGQSVDGNVRQMKAVDMRGSDGPGGASEARAGLPQSNVFTSSSSLSRRDLEKVCNVATKAHLSIAMSAQVSDYNRKVFQLALELCFPRLQVSSVKFDSGLGLKVIQKILESIPSFEEAAAGGQTRRLVQQARISRRHPRPRRTAAENDTHTTRQLRSNSSNPAGLSNALGGLDGLGGSGSNAESTLDADCSQPADADAPAMDPAPPLVFLTSLHHMFIDFNSFETREVTALLKALPGPASLWSLGCSFNRIEHKASSLSRQSPLGPDAGSDEAPSRPPPICLLAACLADCTLLTMLDFSNNLLEDGLTQLAHGFSKLPNLEALWLERCHIHPHTLAATCAVLESCFLQAGTAPSKRPALKFVSFAENHLLGSAPLVLSRFFLLFQSSLSSICLNHTRMTGTGLLLCLPALKALHELEILSLSGNDLTAIADGVDALSELLLGDCRSEERLPLFRQQWAGRLAEDSSMMGSVLPPAHTQFTPLQSLVSSAQKQCAEVSRHLVEPNFPCPRLSKCSFYLPSSESISRIEHQTRERRPGLSLAIAIKYK